MLSPTFQRYVFLSVLFLIVVWAWVIQANTYMNVDVGWFLEASQRMLEGGNYTNDFFENNPPWILYLTIPPVLFSKIFAVTPALAMNLYAFLFAIISLGISYHFLLKNFAKAELYLARFLLIVLAFSFLVLPSYEFNQREHLFFILSMPYLLMMAERLQNRNVNFYLASAVGLLSGIVFILKPYFLMTLFLVELYYLVRKKNIKAMIRPETMVILALLITYLVIIDLYHRDYLTTVLPLAVRYCYYAARGPLILLFFNQYCIACYFFISFSLVSFKFNRFRSLTVILLLAWLGFFFSYLVQQEDVYYRLIPAYGMSLCIFVLAFASYLSTPIRHSHVYTWTIYLTLFIFIYLKRTTYLFDYFPLFYPLSSFFFVTAIFIVVIYFLQTTVKLTFEFYKRFLILFFLMGSFIYGLTYYTGLPELAAFAIDLIAIVMYGCLIPSDDKNKKYYILFICVGCVVVLLPFIQFLTLLKITKESKDNYVTLVNYMNDHIPQKSYYFLTTDIPHMMEPNAHNTSRFSFFWMLPGLVKQSYHLKGKESYEQNNKDKKFFVDMVAEDLITKKPGWVFVDNLTKKSYLTWRTSHTITPISFNFLTYFNNNQKFKNAWQHYRYLTTIKDDSSMSLNPYEYILQLSYKHVPEASAYKIGYLYLYLNNKNHVEMAFRDQNTNIRRMEVSLDENQLRGIQHVLETPGEQLGRRDKMVFFKWILKQSIAEEVYNYDIYQRSD